MFDVGGPIEQVTELVSVDVSTVPAEDLFESMVAVAGLRSQLEHFLARAMAELDDTGAMDDRKALTSSSWLAREAQLPRSLTARWARTGAQLRKRFDLIDAAVSDGRLSSTQAQFVAGLANPRIADKLADLQQEIIDLAEGASHKVFCAEVRVIAETLDEDGGHDPAADIERNRLKLAKLMNGLVKVDLELVGEQALLFEHGVNQRADELFHQYKPDAEATDGALTIPSRSTLMALAVIDLIRRGQAVDEHSTVPPKPEVTFIARADEPGTIRDTHGHTLPDGRVVTVCCDPDIWSIIANTVGIPLDLGRKTRRATKAQRKAMAERDGGCVFPGCHAPAAWTDAHHVREWTLFKGDTDLANLASLCRRHHGVAHRKGWKLGATDEGWFHWTTPSGEPFWGQRHGRQRTGPPPPAQAPPLRRAA